MHEKVIKNVALVYRTRTKQATQVAKKLAAWLLENEFIVFCHPDQATLNKHVKKLSGSRALDNIDLVIVLGGDGTYLEAVRMMKGRPAPFLGINLGSLGFLTVNKIQDLYKVVGMAVEGKCKVLPRAQIHLKLKRKRKLKLECLALNDVVIERGANSHLITMGIYLGKQFVCEIKADGLIVATPTGSTAYNLSAGGPVLDSDVRAFVANPICPHSLTNRPIIFSDDQALTIKILDENEKASLTVDGQSQGVITGNDEIVLMRSQSDHFIVRQEGHNFYSLLRDKLKFGERA